MKRLIGRVVTLLAVATATTALLPATGAHAEIMTLCDNIDPTYEPFIKVEVPGGLGWVEINPALEQDVYVAYDGPDYPLDTLVGADLGTLALDEDLVVCLRLPVVGNHHVIVNVTDLRIAFCSWIGEPPNGYWTCSVDI